MSACESRRWRFAVAAIALGATLLPATRSRAAGAQAAPAVRADIGGAILANGDEMRFLRALARLDSARAVSPLIQPFGASHEAKWRARVGQSTIAPSAAPRWRLLRPNVYMVFNSALPVAQNDGVVWAGRGMTVAAQGGVAADWRGIRAQFAPIVFSAENADFEIAPNGRPGFRQFGDARFPTRIDHPQRFGTERYSRFDWGESFVEVERLGILFGVSNARQQWGPLAEYALVVSSNSGGFTHVHVGTASPRDVRIGRVALRLIAGRLEQSAYSTVDTGETARFVSGVVGSFSPAAMPSVEAGAIRIVTGAWGPRGLTLAQAFRPFQGVISDNITAINKNRENQFAALFVRIAPALSGFEAYAEISREDFAGNWRWLSLQPDDLTDYAMGVSQSRRRQDGSLTVLRFEMVNGELSHQERLLRGNAEPFPPYLHNRSRQGLSNRGQLLGSPAAFGGGGATVAWDHYGEAGRTSIALERQMILDWLPAQSIIGGVPHAEVRYGMRAEISRMRGSQEWTFGVAPSLTLNRNLESGRDVFNLNVLLRLRGY
jgi:hypothetical protein